jgi:lipoprotein-anchoring transpeptidase ErfK/SrfK
MGMGHRFATAQSTVTMRRLRAPAIVALATMATMTAVSTAAAQRQARPAAPTEATAPREAGEPIMAIVSIKSQQVIFYDADGWIVRAPVSTGTTGRETPAGIFAVIEKDKHHRSTMYDDASMPNMQRITWNGIALHGGPLPGYAASHGCVRMPFGFAEKMFDKTRIGMRVIVSPNDAAPVDFSHPSLPVPNPEAIAAAPGRAVPLTREATETAKAADEAKKAIATLAREATQLTMAVRRAEMLKKSADAELVYADKAFTAADQAKTRADGVKQKAAAKAADLAAQLEKAKADAKPKLDAAAAAIAAAKDAPKTDDEAKKAAAVAAQAAAAAAREAALVTASLQKLEMLKKSADAELAMADKMLAAADQARTRAEEMKRKAAAKAADLSKQFDTAKANVKRNQDAAVAAKEAAKAAETKNAAAAKAALEAKLALEPFSIYISRATQKLYVRRNTHKPAPDGGGEVFDFSIEVPVTIRNPEKRLGTHVLTAMAKSDAGLRWTSVSIDGEDPKESFDRITIPQEVLDRLAPTALPRSSIVISDEPLSKETNYRTEFVTVLQDHPQGGFITRKPTPRDDFRVASRNSRDDNGFFSFFNRNPEPEPANSRRRRGGPDDRSQRNEWWQNNDRWQQNDRTLQRW